MSYPYVTRPIKNPRDRSVKYYVQAAPQKPVDLKTIAERIEKRSTVSIADVKAVLAALEFEVIQALKEGHTVRLGDLGSFYTRLQSKGAETQEECWQKGAQLVTRISCAFLRSKAMSDELQPSKVGLTPSDAEQAKKDAAHNGN